MVRGRGVHQDGVAFGKTAGDQLQSQRILDQALDGALHGTGAVLKVVPLGDDPVLGGSGDFQFQVAVLEQFTHVVELYIHNPRQVFAGQRVKHNDIVNPIEELRAEL